MALFHTPPGRFRTPPIASTTPRCATPHTPAPHARTHPGPRHPHTPRSPTPAHTPVPYTPTHPGPLRPHTPRSATPPHTPVPYAPTHPGDLRPCDPDRPVRHTPWFSPGISGCRRHRRHDQQAGSSRSTHRCSVTTVGRLIPSHGRRDSVHGGTPTAGKLQQPESRPGAWMPWMPTRRPCPSPCDRADRRPRAGLPGVSGGGPWRLSGEVSPRVPHRVPGVRSSPSQHGPGGRTSDTCGREGMPGPLHVWLSAQTCEYLRTHRPAFPATKDGRRVGPSWAVGRGRECAGAAPQYLGAVRRSGAAEGNGGSGAVHARIRTRP
ncbi:hypothetical protein Cfla_3723 [Cellulomonas flavigena DSM 20109]|uniref:Uncharacterized protein n=1 Tax=Cellulomonas flavigena (strain ATCC 482 / DSM 20109 / BCRC 11376 / JCM 18109 / NBRC 3775 / NCIMB 8073 / NRS 134) TaxID=446466 RepID=D5UEB5_CELFN|nr:hypothetical protein Cfla_3723 [Cellulomonas flavigena DSM 20109]